MANQYLAVVQQLGAALGRIVGVLDENGVVVACSSFPLINTTRVGLSWDSSSPANSPAICPSFKTYTLSHIPIISGSSEEITIIAFPALASSRIMQ